MSSCHFQAFSPDRSPISSSLPAFRILRTWHQFTREAPLHFMNRYERKRGPYQPRNRESILPILTLDTFCVCCVDSENFLTRKERSNCPGKCVFKHYKLSIAFFLGKRARYRKKAFIFRPHKLSITTDTVCMCDQWSQAFKYE